MNLSSTVNTLSTLAIALLLQSTSANALSCAMRNFTLAEAYEEADSIIVGLVTECAQLKSADRWAGGSDQCSFVTLEALKESMPARDYAGGASSSGCGLSLHVGEQYLLFLDEQNRPLWYSETLQGNAWTTQLVEQRIRILRDFRNGVAADLSEPWISHESIIGTCTLTHSVDGHRIAFSRRPTDAVPIEEIEWSQIAIDGSPIFTPEQANDITRQIQETPKPPPQNLQMIEVKFREQSPSAPRNATIRVGNRSWPLERRDSSREDDSQMIALPTVYFYSAKGATAEEILSALETPSDVVATATLVPPSAASATKTEPQAETRTAYRREPEPVLRFETRSTNLASTIDTYRSCYSVNE